MGSFNEATWRRCVISMVVALFAGLGVSGHLIDCVGFTGIERRVDQITLQRNECDKRLNLGVEKEGFIMGYGGALTLVNGSPFNWVTSSTPSYQMDAWSWPTVNAGRVLYQSTSQQKADTMQEKLLGYISNLGRKGKLKTMQERHTITSRALQTSLQC
jgi:hypothetical protein